MSDTYTKLFRSITASTIVSEPLATRWLWVTMLSQADSAGCVWGSVPGLARLANITLAECEAGLGCFFAPDPYSRTQEHEGRRIEAVDGGWLLLNHAKYASIRGLEERREYMREYMRNRRHGGGDPVNNVNSVNSVLAKVSSLAPPSPSPTPTEALAPAKQTKKEQELAPRAKKQRATPSVPQPLDPAELAGTLPLVDGTDYEVSKSLLADLAPAYPGIDCKAELRKVKAWLVSNPKNRKTRTGIVRFLNAWLAREQNKTGVIQHARQPALSNVERIRAAAAQRKAEQADG